MGTDSVWPTIMDNARCHSDYEFSRDVIRRNADESMMCAPTRDMTLTNAGRTTKRCDMFSEQLTLKTSNNMCSVKQETWHYSTAARLVESLTYVRLAQSIAFTQRNKQKHRTSHRCSRCRSVFPEGQRSPPPKDISPTSWVQLSLPGTVVTEIKCVFNNGVP